MARHYQKQQFLHVLIGERPDRSLRAHCLEFDLEASARNEAEAKGKMIALINAHLKSAAKLKANPFVMPSIDVLTKYVESMKSNKVFVVTVECSDEEQVNVEFYQQESFAVA